MDVVQTDVIQRAAPTVVHLPARQPRRIRLSGRVQLAAGVRVVQRDDHTIQLGIDDTRRVIIANAPPGTLELLTTLAHDRVEDSEVGRLGGLRLTADTLADLLDDLVRQGFLVRPDAQAAIPTPARCVPERVSLSTATGALRAAEAMRRRAEAAVLVRGSGRVAGSVSTVLAAAGVGHVHQQPDRAIRPVDGAPAGLGRAELTGLTATGDRPGSAEPESRLASGSAAGRADRLALAAMLRRVSPEVRVHPPTGQRPSVVVLAGDGPPSDEAVRPLIADGIPHLVVRVTESNGVVGPFVLPGRSSCAHCHDLHRTDADPGWPRIRLALLEQSPVPAVGLATQVAALAARDVLRYLDDQPPWTVDGTLEVPLADWHVRRRSWHPHPLCFCRSTTVR